MKQKTKSPSVLWNEASEEGRAQLLMIVKKLHSIWQESPHFSAKEERNRIPNVTFELGGELEDVPFEIRWSGTGANEHLVSVSNFESETFYLLFNQPLIVMGSVWLAVTDEQGFIYPDYLERADQLDFRKHLETHGDKPPFLQWALVELYQLLFFYDPELASCGFKNWGFWHARSPKNFFPLKSNEESHQEFCTLDDLLQESIFCDEFKRATELGKFPYSFEGLTAFSENSKIMCQWEHGEIGFCTLGMYLSQQPRGTIERLFGEADLSLGNLKTIDFTSELERGSYISVLRREVGDVQVSNVVRELLTIGKHLSEIEFRLTEERRALLARKFEQPRTDRTKSAVEANRIDRKLRVKAILKSVSELKRSDFQTKSTGRLNIAKLAEAITHRKPFRTTATGMRLRSLENVLREIKSELIFADD